MELNERNKEVLIESVKNLAKSVKGYSDFNVEVSLNYFNKYVICFISRHADSDDICNCVTNELLNMGFCVSSICSSILVYPEDMEDIITTLRLYNY